MSKMFSPVKSHGIFAVRAEADPVALLNTLNRDWQAFKEGQAEKDRQFNARFDDVVGGRVLPAARLHHSGRDHHGRGLLAAAD